MGTDIYLWIEGKTKEGNWFVANPRYVRYDNPENLQELKEYEVGRSYPLFAALANVRNKHNIPFIQEWRDVPNHASAKVKEELECWRGFGYGFGYISVPELKAYADKYSKEDDENIRYAAEQVKRLYDKLWNLGTEIVDESVDVNDEGHTLRVENMRIIFWFDC